MATAKLIGRTGPIAGKDFVLGDTTRIGSAREAEIRIRAEGVSRIHARLWREDDAYWLEDAGSTNGTLLSGTRVRKDRLRHLDVVTLGRTVDLIFIRTGTQVLPEADAAPAAAARGITSASLIALDGPDTGTVFDLPKGEITFGRADSNTIVVASAAVSKVHARIERVDDAVFIQDLGSVNGTFVNDTRIDDRVVMGRGDRVSLSGVRSFQVTIDRAGGTVVNQAADPLSSSGPVFNQEWKTRLIWSAEELAELAELAQPSPVPDVPPQAPAKAKRKPKPAPQPPARKNAAERPPVARATATVTPGEVVGGTVEPARVAAPVKPTAKPAQPAAAPAKPAAKTAAPAKPFEPEVKQAGPVPLAAPTPGDDPHAASPRVAPPPWEDSVRDDVAATVHAAPAVRLVGRTTYTLAPGTTTIGRAETATIRVDDRKISRLHAEITVAVDAVAIEDKGSFNGTTVNGTEITKRQVLRHGDRVQIGETGWTVEIRLG